MELEYKEFLKEHYNNYETAKSGYVRNLDLPILKMYEHIYRTYIDPNFILTIWCGACRMEMVLRLYKYYENLPIETNEGCIKYPEEEIVIEPKKRGRKPKTNG